MSDDFQREAFQVSLARRAPRLDAWRVLGAFTPSAWGTTVALVAVASMLPALGLAAFLVVAAPNGIDDGTVMVALLIFGAFGAPPASLGLAGSAATAGATGARAVLLAGAAGVLLAGGVSCGVAAEIPSEASRGVGFLWGLAPYAIGAVLLGLLAVALLVRAPAVIRRELEADRERRAVQLLLLGGSVALEDLERGLGTADVEAVLQRLAVSGTLATRVDRALGRVATAERVARRQGLLLAEVERRQNAELDALAEVVREPEPVVRAWLTELVETGVLDATVDDATVAFKALRPFRACQGCGGPVAAVGGQLGRCGHCGSEAYG